MASQNVLVTLIEKCQRQQPNGLQLSTDEYVVPMAWRKALITELRGMYRHQGHAFASVAEHALSLLDRYISLCGKENGPINRLQYTIFGYAALLIAAKIRLREERSEQFNVPEKQAITAAVNAAEQKIVRKLDWRVHHIVASDISSAFVSLAKQQFQRRAKSKADCVALRPVRSEAVVGPLVVTGLGDAKFRGQTRIVSAVGIAMAYCQLVGIPSDCWPSVQNCLSRPDESSVSDAAAYFTTMIRLCQTPRPISALPLQAVKSEPVAPKSEPTPAQVGFI